MFKSAFTLIYILIAFVLLVNKVIYKYKHLNMNKEATVFENVNYFLLHNSFLSNDP